MDRVNVTDEFSYKGTVEFKEIVKHFTLNGVKGKYIDERSSKGRIRMLEYGNIVAVAARSDNWMVKGLLTDELASAFNLAFQETFDAIDGITVVSYIEEHRDIEYITAIWSVLYKGELGTIEVEYAYGDGGRPEYLSLRLKGVSGFVNGDDVKIKGKLPDNIRKRIEDITGYPIPVKEREEVQ